ncbi:MAG: phosphotransferase [Candidatus Pacebacteria bacterium]|nr:phosphotransferase [Candidatus Paceibacterota bacterium]MDD5357052.1 phosphotransferase [Candidatus Paceibacterota bacterium]
MEKSEIIVEGKTYIHVRTRHQVPVSIYKGNATFLRIGPKELIEKEVQFHKKLVHFGYPLAQIVGEGQYEDKSYFIESSLGEFHFGQICAQDFAKNGFVSDSTFQSLLAVTKKYAEAQLKTASKDIFNKEEFQKLIQFETILEEAKHLKEKSKACMKKVESHIKELPTVITHGDFNPHNIFEKGVIDWERTAYAPAGYDLVTNITQIFFFPRWGKYEYMGKYVFSKEQVDRYWTEIDALYESKGLPKLSDYADDFIFCRSVWSVVRMEKWPDIQKWRYTLHEKIMDAYLKGENLTELLLENSN